MIDENNRCGDCIHAEVCELNEELTMFNKDNIAFCKGFKHKGDEE